MLDKTKKQWVVWRREALKDGKITKVPYQIDGRKAISTKKETWYSFDEVTEARALFDG